MHTAGLPHVSNVIFGLDPMILSTAILVISYIILFTEKLNRAVVALLGATIMIFAGVLTQETALAGIDFNTLALLIGMMTIVGIAEKSGMFQFVAVWSAKKVKASPRGLMVVLAVVTAVFSALLDNVTTVLLVAPVTFQITRKLKINPYPYLILEIFASNIGGTATLIGDPPNILIGSALGLSFMDFVYELTPIVTITMFVLILAFDLIWGRNMITSEKNKKAVMSISAIDCITDWSLLRKSLFVLLAVIGGFMAAEHLHIANGTIAIFGAAILLLLYTWGNSHDDRDHKIEEAFGLVDWTTIFFFAGLFAIVYGLEEAGVLSLLGNKFVEITDGSIEKAAMLVVWISAFVSTAIDNIPFVATMIPMIKSMEPSMGGREAMMPVWWALSLGACFGGNGSLIAASANVIVAGMAQREGHPIHFMKFLIWSIPVMLISVGISAVYLHIIHFM
ncbi:MAG: ArsB/NhaD family transporter [Alphaproteobacteria bacterium]|nr:ArsB/NhaD family transporter [Alphaproteobacteria bacterium]